MNMNAVCLLRLSFIVKCDNYLNVIDTNTDMG